MTSPGASPAFPLPRCVTCRSLEACAAGAAARPEYPACHDPVRRTHLGRLTALARAWAAHDDIKDPRASALLGELLRRHRRDRERYSEIFEPSFSVDERGAHLFRLSYAFPGFRRDPADAVRALLALAAPGGNGLAREIKGMLRLALAPAVEQPIFGVAWEANGRARIKLYLQFARGAGEAAIAIAEAVTGGRGVATAARGRALHLLGMDFALDRTFQGRAGARLYFVVPSLPLATPGAEGLPPTPLLVDLGARGVAVLRNVLAIHRLDGEAFSADPGEIDFGLVDSDLRWGDVRALPAAAGLLAGAPAIAAMEREFRLGVRRVSINAGAPRKLTAYYVLAEEEPGPGDAVPGVT